MVQIATVKAILKLVINMGATKMTKFVKNLLGSAILLTSPMVSYAAEWAYITSSKDNHKYYIDKQSYKYDKTTHIATFWRQDKYIKSDGSSYVTHKVLQQIDCVNQKSRSLNSVKYTYNGSVLSSYDKPSSYSIIVPDTIGEALWESACKNKGKGLYFNPSTVRHIDDLKSRGVELKPFTPPKLMSLDELKASWSTETSTQQPQPARRFLTDDEIRQVLPHINHPANRQNQLPQLNESQRINLD